jgi:hypothetical protein
MDKLVAQMSVDFESVDDEKSLSPTQPVLLSQNMHLLQNNNDPELIKEKRKMMPTEKLDLQSLLSDSSSSITEEEVIDTRKQKESDDDELPEPSQSQKKNNKKKQPTRKQKS